MKKYYKVVTTFNDIGIVTANSFLVEAEQKPENTYKSNKTQDIYEDYFENPIEAEDFRQEALNA